VIDHRTYPGGQKHDIRTARLPQSVESLSACTNSPRARHNQLTCSHVPFTSCSDSMTITASPHTLRVQVEYREPAINVTAALAPVPEEVVVLYLRKVSTLLEPTASRPPS